MANIAKPTDGSRLSERFTHLDSLRGTKLERARYMSSLTIPSLLPIDGITGNGEMPKPYSSVASRGVTNMASRMLSALLPLNDLPFFKFELNSGNEADPDTFSYMEALSHQIYSKLTTKNLRESLFLMLQQLIVNGDCMVIMEDDYSFRVYRLDQYVVRRDIDGSVVELIYLDWVPKEPNSNMYEAYDMNFFPSSLNASNALPDYQAHFNRIVWNSEEEGWDYYSEDSEGNEVEEGQYKNTPFLPLRWIGVTGEDYGRSHCEEVLGDIETLEAYTKALIDGMTAASTFWVAVDPAGITDLEDVASSPTGSFIGARNQDVFTISPAQTISPQLNAAQTAVEQMRREVGAAFLLGSVGIRQADRVTATEVRMLGMEIENVLGGAFSAIARSLLEPVVRRTIALMIKNNEIDERLEEEFMEKGQLSVNIVTGLQALSRESDLTKLMQLGEMVRNLPPEAIKHFRWDQYGIALISSLGFDPRNWVRNETETDQRMMDQQQQMMEMQAQQAIAMGAAQGAGSAAGQVAQTGINNAAMQLMQQGGM
ncbi:MAG: hypothetical protein CMA63_02695 [Euryarchaeota archaeon]|nr:hypothetical protein [Euryarchaeota archaeon]|tara:strand:+ start:24191 stop:25810 length:1620 start_codon:yes stop_codon:yes gene_type:complete